MPTSLKGLTLDHPRAVAPLHAHRAAWAMRRPDLRVAWATQPLARFEVRPRFPVYFGFQRAAGPLVDACARAAGPERTHDRRNGTRSAARWRAR